MNLTNIKIFDTTLRDGEQSPGCTMNLNEKLIIAKALDDMGVDIIEAGFPASSNGDFLAVLEIGKCIKNSTVCALARANVEDIDKAFEALKYADKKLIHIFIATSDIHLEHKLKLTMDEVLIKIKDMVSYGKSLCENIEFSAEDAMRSDINFLVKALQTAIDSGATTINIPDTVGYITPNEMYDRIKFIKEHLVNAKDVVISVHCHNDLGLATANSLSALLAGANQVECTVNALGERAGNASLEEIVMAIKTRENYYNIKTSINHKLIYKTSKLVESISGIEIAPNKAIVGGNAFAHESGIHQHGILANRDTYEIMDPKSIGIQDKNLVLGKHSGRHAFTDRLEELGYNLSKEENDIAFEQFKKLSDKKKMLSDRDILAILSDKKISNNEEYGLIRFVINTGNSITSTAMIKVLKSGETIEEVAIGSGPIDAAFKVLNKISGFDIELDDYHIRAMTEGEDALGEAVVKVSFDGKKFIGRAISTDIIEASIKAYINGINKISDC